MATMKSMPQYQSIKKVWALKMETIVFDADLAKKENRETDGTAIFTAEEQGFALIKLPAEFVSKHNPKAGGYYVTYKDGYQSWSPADAFEEGYVLI